MNFGVCQHNSLSALKRIKHENMSNHFQLNYLHQNYTRYSHDKWRRILSNKFKNKTLNKLSSEVM